MFDKDLNVQNKLTFKHLAEQTSDVDIFDEILNINNPSFNANNHIYFEQESEMFDMMIIFKKLALFLLTSMLISFTLYMLVKYKSLVLLILKYAFKCCCYCCCKNKQKKRRKHNSDYHECIEMKQNNKYIYFSFQMIILIQLLFIE